MTWRATPRSLWREDGDQFIARTKVQNQIAQGCPVGMGRTLRTDRSSMPARCLTSCALAGSVDSCGRRCRRQLAGRNALDPDLTPATVIDQLFEDMAEVIEKHVGHSIDELAVAV